ncbi:terminase small subunit [Endozoicomonas sp. ONNA2]|uniref:terminase small subunit n=1 Tax=Endozoicomonas sp. ONNA2 TaxID=2828741 RepID=UPI002147B919|nr:terminase small subunit [Endozoicomonas sp. ONNA2]
MKLNHRQSAFINEYLVQPTVADAVVKAGYKTVNPHATGSKLLANPAVKAELRFRQQEERQRQQSCRGQLASMLMELYHSSDNIIERLGVLDRLARLYGYY